MKLTCYWASAGVLAVAATGAVAADEVLVPGDPPLTRAVAEGRIDYWEWVLDVRLDDRQRAELLRLQVDEWKFKGKEWKDRWGNFLPGWRGALAADGSDHARLKAANRHAALDGLARGGGDAVGQWLLARHGQPATPASLDAARRAGSAREAERVRLAMAQMRYAQHHEFLRDLSAAQARHHETVMHIIRCMAPTPPDGRRDPNK
jgi:hypothetical protein